MTTAFIILAAGQGHRLGGEPKQFRLLGEKPVWRWSYDVARRLLDEGRISQIVIVVPPDMPASELAADLPAPAAVVGGGSTRSGSTLNALKACDADVVLLHDAARPFVDVALCHRLLDASTGSNGVIPVLPEPNALKRIHDGEITAVDRDDLYITQTPQLFPRATLMDLLQGAGALAFKDEAELWLARGKDLATVLGDSLNNKITRKGDWQMACALAGERQSRSGLGYDIHPLIPGRPLILGGVEIPSPLGLDGHSDADALCHAIADAVLSAAGLPDIGTLYPASDKRYKGADSTKLLADALDKVGREGWTVEWISAVLTAQVPRLASWKEKILASLASVIGSPCCSVTFKSGEHVGAVGDARSICVWVSATIARGATRAQSE